MKLKLEISNNNLKAYLTSLETDKEDKPKPITSEQIIELLKEKKIIFGVNQDAIAKFVDKKVPVVDVVIAEGKSPSIGNTAEVKVHKRPKKREDVMPKANEEGDIDYISPREGWIVVVNKEDEIAVKIPPTQGKAGMDIFGQEIPGIWGKDFELEEIGGINTEVDGDVLLSSIDGFVVPRATKMNVEPVFRIYDDVGPSTGSIEIPAKYKVEVAISKDIKSGYWVKAHKISVGGCVEDCEIEAYELIVEQGIVGVSEIPINADKIRVGYINGSRHVISKGIHVTREISNGAHVHARQIKAHTIQGSTIVAGEGIWAEFINGQNKIYVGVDHKAKTVYDKCTTELNDMEEPFEQLKVGWRNNEKRMVYLKELSKKYPQHPLIAKELPQIKEIKEKFDYFQKKMESLKKEQEDALKKMYPTDKPFLLIRVGFAKDNSSGSIIEPQTTINIGEEVRRILEPTKGGLMTYHEDKFASSQKYNIKEVKTKLPLIEW